MPALTTQQLADYETLTMVFYAVLRELGLKSDHAPSAQQILFWVDLYGYDFTEAGIQKGLRGFAKKVPNGIKSAKDGVYMLNYLNATIKGLKGDLIPARVSPGEDRRAI
jgi:hypothetical protein